MIFFISIPVLKRWECNFSFPFLSRDWVIKVGNQIRNELPKLGLLKIDLGLNLAPPHLHLKLFPFSIIPGNTSSIHSRPQKLGRQFSFLFPIIGNVISHSRSHFQKLEVQFFISIHFPKIWEWAELFPFLFPKSKMPFPLPHPWPDQIGTYENVGNFSRNMCL